MSVSPCCSRPDCLNLAGELFDSTSFKVNTLVTFLLLTATLTIWLCQVNAIATYTMLGFSCISLLINCALGCFCRSREEETIQEGSFLTLVTNETENIGNSRFSDTIDTFSPIINERREDSNTSSFFDITLTPVKKEQPKKTTKFMGSDLPLIDDEETSESEEGKKIVIIDRKTTQCERFGKLEKGSNREGIAHFSCFSMGEFNPQCDQYKTGFPSFTSRVYLEDKTPTNGALVWEKLILMQGPHNENQIEHLWRIAAEKKCRAIIRLGPLKGYKPYCPTEKDFSFGDLIIGCPLENGDKLFHSTSCTIYPIEFNGDKKEFPIYAMHKWKDFQTNKIEEIYQLIIELEKIEGPLIIHCRGGFGRTGTFAVCWKIYQLYKEAVTFPLKVDPAALIDEMRDSRCSTVQTLEQFLMILDFIDYLNNQSKSF